MMTREIYSDLPIPPGNFLEEVLDDMGMGKDELAKRMNRPPAKLSQIFNGQKSITPETALQLERVTGVPAHIWTGLETEYRLTLARLQEEKEQESRKKEVQLVTKYYYKELVKLGLVESKTNPVEKVVELQKYFGITSLLNLDGIRRYQILYRQANSKKNKVSPEALTAWLRMGEIKAYKIDCLPYSEKKLIQIIPEIRSMTLKTPREYQIVLEAM
ncbi:MAG: HigA family addiction module antitoxin, partial [Bacillota bacterium]